MESPRLVTVLATPLPVCCTVLPAEGLALPTVWPTWLVTPETVFPTVCEVS